MLSFSYRSRESWMSRSDLSIDPLIFVRGGVTRLVTRDAGVLEPHGLGASKYTLCRI